MATIMNGVASVIKASAVCGADKETCAKVIFIATLLQTVFGVMSMMGSMASMGNIKDAGYKPLEDPSSLLTLADLQKQIEELMANQLFTDGVQKWIEARNARQRSISNYRAPSRTEYAISQERIEHY